VKGLLITELERVTAESSAALQKHFIAHFPSFFQAVDQQYVASETKIKVVMQKVEQDQPINQEEYQSLIQATNELASMTHFFSVSHLVNL